MTYHFHRNLNRMALFTALLAIGLILFRDTFLRIALTNIYLNGVIIGATLFGIGLCFVEIFRLVPEYRWLRAYSQGRRRVALPPRLLRPIALILHRRPAQISATMLYGMLDMVLVRMDDSRESIRYATNILIFLGLLGTFWGLIVTVGGFADLLGNINFADDSALDQMTMAMSGPLHGMSTAFTSSLMGLGGSLVVGFLGLQVQLAQNAIFNETEEFFATHTRPAGAPRANGQ